MTDIAGGLVTEDSGSTGGILLRKSPGAALPSANAATSGNPLRKSTASLILTGVTTTTLHYRKRAWRAESSAYVTWDTTNSGDTYPGGGTLTPTLGVVIYTWVTSP